MKYYLIVGEASGDLHASHLMKALARHDAEAQFRFFGGDLMAAQGGTLVKHYRELAYMGFVPVLMHLPIILGNMSFCKKDIKQWNPDVVILVDYPGFNLSVAKHLHAHTSIPVYYYISPKIWAWKEYRITSIRRDISHLFSILPFEVPFYHQRNFSSIHYVGNPTAQEVSEFLDEHPREHSSDTKPVIALLAGSRRQEIKDNLPAMIEAAMPFAEHYRLVLAGAPGIEPDFYHSFLSGKSVEMVTNQTYPLLARATAALVTSGTATLETALFGVPQVVCYKTPVPHLIRFAFNHIIKCKYISLVNLVADEEIVPELLADRFSVSNIHSELARILPGQSAREAQLQGYSRVRQVLGSDSAPENAARLMVQMLQSAQKG